ncbi:MAG: hypothetical protein HQ593_00660 [Candidatus Omnitrophica bacterium]|nr:hypothetical protein [Candidatus Omnitrophota bacterium]
MKEVVLPELAEGVNEATVSFWHIEEGDVVKEGQDLVEMATDKAVFNVPSPAAGVLIEALVHEGDVVKVGEILAKIKIGE